MPSLTQVIKIDVEDGALRCERQAEYGYDTVHGRAAGRDLGRRRDQRAALPVAEGDHGREEEAARHQVATGDVGIERRPVGCDNAARPLRRLQGARRQGGPGQIIEDEDTDETVEQIVAWLDERKLLGMSWASWSTRCTTTARSTRTRSAPSPRAPGWPASSAASATSSWSATRPASPTTCARSLGRYGAAKVLPRRGPRGPRAAGRRRDGEDHRRAAATATRCSAAACSASRSAPA